MTQVPPGALTERLTEMVMEDTEAQNWVNNTAQEWLDHFLSTTNTVGTPQNVLDELLCQYQTVAWKNLFREVMI